MTDRAKNLSSLTVAFDRLCRNPMQLRAALAVTLVGGWYLAAYQPLIGKLEMAQQRLATERKRLALAESIEVLQSQVEQFQGHLPPRSDPNEAVNYLLDGVRSLPVRLISLDPGQTRDFGPYKAVAVKLKAEGTYSNLDRMLRWVETNPRLLRVETITIAPLGGPPSAADEEPKFTIDLEIAGVIG